MASWNIPALINKISEDVPAIKALLTALFKWTDAGTEDVPEGAKRLQSVTGGRQIQEYSGSSWGSVGKLMHDVDMLDGKHASTAQTPDTIPVRDANGSIPGNITGNAATATTASSVSNEYVVPIANGGTGATSAAGARTNLGTDNAENITQGVLATARGGTGRSDGKVTDVFLTDYQTGAVGLGQLGQAVTKNAVDCDTLTRQGKYYCTGATLALHYPFAGTVALDVYNSGDVVIQNAYSGDVRQMWRRISTNGGASWQPWLAIKYNVGGDVHIYVAKNGSDAYTGMSADNPVLTINRAMEVARGVSCAGDIVFHFGAGEWGTATFHQCMFTCRAVVIANYSLSTTVTTKAAFDALTDVPHFTGLNLYIGRYCTYGLSVDFLNAIDTVIEKSAYIKFGFMAIIHTLATFGSATIANTGTTNSVFTLYNSCLRITGNSVITFENGISNGAFIGVVNKSDVQIDGTTTFSGTFNGIRYIFLAWCSIPNGSMHPYDWPGAGGTGSFFPGYSIYANGGMELKSSYPSIVIRETDMVRGTAPSAFYEKLLLQGWTANNHQTWGLWHTYETNRKHMIRLLCYRGTTTDTTWYALGIGSDADGNAVTEAPTPPAADNSSQIATTYWVRYASGNTSLNAATATKLATARTIFGRSFDGSGNVAGLVEATNIELNGGTNHGGYIDFHFNGSTADFTTRLIEEKQNILSLGGQLRITTTGIAHIRMHTGAKTFMFRNDGANFYILKAADNDTWGSWDETRPLIVNGTTGICSINGNAATATKSNTADTPAANDNSTRTATTAWVRGRLSGSEYSMVPSKNPEQRSVGTTYTAGTNGFFKVETNDIGDYWAGVWINGHESRVHIGEYGSGGNWSGNLVFIPVKKGWTYSCYSCSWCAFQAAG